MSKNLKDLNNLLFEQIELLNNTSVKDENFEAIRNKVETVSNVADRIIRNAELDLRYQVWSANKEFKLNIRQIGCAD